MSRPSHVHPPPRAPRPSHDVTMAFVAHGMKKLSLHGRLASPSLRPWAGGKDPRRATGGREGLSRTPWLLAIFMLSSWQCLPSQSSNCVQLLSTILPPWRGWVKRTSWSIDTPCFDWHFHLQTYAGALDLWLAQRSTRWLFPDTPPDLVISKQAENVEFPTSPKSDLTRSPSLWVPWVTLRRG